MDTDKYIGRLLDNRYEIQEVIGIGGMAVVYKARCHRLNRSVAIKILKEDYCQDEDFRRRFHAESQAVAMLSHPNIVSVYDVSSSTNADYIVMELIEGISLKQYMEKKGVLNWKETLHFAIQIGKALEHAHSRGIVHRDIKPHNVMVLKNGSVKVTDFGIARMMSKGNTLTKEALGSVHYISPEQAKGGRVDNRSDIYSLGVVMYEMMTGRPPYDGESPVAVAIQHINGGAPMPSSINPNIPDGLEQIIMKAMAHDPDNRYLTATQMLYDMDEFRKNPVMLFDYHSGSLEDMPQRPMVVEMPKPPRTTAEAVAAAKTASGTGRLPAQNRPAGQTSRQGTSRNSRTGTSQRHNAPAKSRRSSAEDTRNNVATIAVIACALVAILAIGIFLFVILQNGPATNRTEYVSVPTYVGKNYDTIPTTEGLIIRLAEQRYSDTYKGGQVIEQQPQPGEKVVMGTEVTLVVSLGPEPQVKTMERLIGLEQTVVENFLKKQDLVALIRAENSNEFDVGVVMRTEPAEGQPLTDGQTVIIWVSKGPEVVKNILPNVVGLNLATALRILESSEFTNVEFEQVESNEPKDQVIWQSEERNVKLDVTTVIVLKVSMGPAETEPEPTQEPTTQPTTAPTVPETEPATQPTTEPATQPTTQPTTPTTQPTTPAVTPVRKTVVFWLPVKDVQYTLRIDNITSGGTVHTASIAPGTDNVQVSLVGTGTQEYEIFIDSKSEGTQKVEFGSQ